MSMAAKTSDRGDDRLKLIFRRLAQRKGQPKGWQTIMKQKRRTVLPIIHQCGPHPEAANRPSQYELLLVDTSYLDR